MQLKTVSGATVFSAEVITGMNDIEVVKTEEGYFATKKNKIVGQIYGNVVIVDGEEVKLSELVPSVDMAELLAKNPIDLTKDELILVTHHLKGIAADKLNLPPAPEKTAKTEKADKKAAKAEAAAPAAPKAEEAGDAAEKVYTAAELEKLGAKDLWKQVIQPIADKLEGITSRSKKDEMIEAYLKFTGQAEEAAEEEQEEAPKAKGKGKAKPAPAEEEEDDEEEEEDEESDDDSDEDSDDEEEEDEDSDDEDEEEEDDEDSDSDDEDDEDEEEDEEDDEDEESDDDDSDDDDSDEEDDEEEDEDEDEEDELPVIKKPADIDDIDSREVLQALIRKHGVKLPKGEKLSVAKVKQLIKDQLFAKKGKK